MARGVLRPMVRIAAAYLPALIVEEQHRNLLLISAGFQSVVGSAVTSLMASCLAK